MRIILVILFINFSFSNKTDFTNNHYKSRSIGFSDKIPLALYDFTKLIKIDENSEYYLSFWSMIFGSGVGGGHKKYLGGNNKTFFISSGLYFHMLGTLDDGIAIRGIHTSPGWRIPYKNKSDTFINLGITISYYDGILMRGGSEKLFFVFPFLNYEMRF